jgi:uncharacterized membrane protein YccF (DUF307 family)
VATSTEPINPHSAWEQVKFGLKLTAWLFWCIPWSAAGVALCLTVVGIPLGFGSFSIAAWPLVHMVERRNRMAVAYEDRWSYVGKEGEEPDEVPWIV